MLLLEHGGGGHGVMATVNDHMNIQLICTVERPLILRLSPHGSPLGRLSLSAIVGFRFRQLEL